MKVIVFTSLFPNEVQPDHAIFIKNRMEAVQRTQGVEVKVVAPVPYFPKFPFSCSLFSRWRVFSDIPKNEWIGNLEVWHPRYLVIPKIGMSIHGLFMFLGSYLSVRKIYKEYQFDIIDGHYIYPDGLAAVLLGKLFKVPVVLSARGTDINLYPQIPLIGIIIRYVLKRAEKAIAVCADLKKIMVSLGIESDKIKVISNGINPQQFYFIDKKTSRRLVNIKEGGKILLSVGSLIERKGHHILIDALGRLHAEGKLHWTTYILGQGEWYGKLVTMIREKNLADKVVLCGQVANTRLVYWYNAADLFFLGSSREGWPNVVSESLACGTPVIATPANGIPEIIASHEYGVVLKERTTQHFYEEIPKAFERSWNFEKIYAYGRSRTWDTVAEEVKETFDQVMNNR